MKKNSSLIIGVIVVIVVIVGGYMLLHKSNTTTTNNSASQNNAPAVNNAVLITKTDSKVGQYLADPSGKALYTYASDSAGVSKCTGSCLANWPAYQDKGATTGLPAGVGTIKRSDNGQTQYTYQGMPLYYFTGDSAGQVTGNGVESFSVAKPAAASSSQSSSTPSSSSSPAQSTQSNSNSSGYNY